MSTKRRKTGGRRTKCTPELTKRFAIQMQRGHTIPVVARSLGLIPRTVYNWMRDGERNSRGVYRQFFLAVRKAELKAVQRAEQQLLELVNTGHAASIKFFLQQRGTKDWHRRGTMRLEGQVEHTGQVVQQHEGTVQVAAQVEIVQPMFSDEQLLQASESPKLLESMRALVAERYQLEDSESPPQVIEAELVPQGEQ